MNNRGNGLRMGDGNRNGREGVIGKKEGEMKRGKGEKRRGLSHVGEMVGGANSITAITTFTTAKTNRLLAKWTIVMYSCYERDGERLRIHA